ncbi:MAG TPA: hypothetical protein VL921_18110 [Candidatus Udaeobacter sp.]|nr:hypothetical protein [Candidatus Udaeobacter sp.]
MERMYRSGRTMAGLPRSESHQDRLHLLPALPDAWPSGYVKGLRGRGSFEIDLTWENGKITLAVIQSSVTRLCRIFVQQPVRILEGDKVIQAAASKGQYEFQAEQGRQYFVISE